MAVYCIDINAIRYYHSLECVAAGTEGLSLQVTLSSPKLYIFITKRFLGFIKSNFRTFLENWIYFCMCLIELGSLIFCMMQKITFGKIQMDYANG